MKTKINKILGLCALGVFALTSCNSFLDQQETERITFEKIWQKKSYTQGYYIKCFNWMPDLFNPPACLANAAADEASASWTTSTVYNFSYHNVGSWTVSDVKGSNLKDMYAAIRHCTIFLQNIDSAVDLDLTEAEKLGWKTDARFLRAYYYYLAMVQHGPVFLMGETLIDPINSTMEDAAYPRMPWDSCVKYVTHEMEEAMKTLPRTQLATSQDIGRPSKIIAKSLLARLALYSARPLFNDGAGYKNTNNYYTRLTQYPDGTGKQLFPNYDPNKWIKAAEMLKEAIDSAHANGFALYTAGQTPGAAGYNAYKALFGVQDARWNSEIIWGRHQGRGQWTVHIKPRGIQGNAYGGFGPTQRHVDRYAVASGVYPFSPFKEDTYNAGNPEIDPQSGYNEEGFTSLRNPACIQGNAPETSGVDYKAGEAANTFNMYVNREPRFYCNIFWSGARWPQHPYTKSYFHTGALNLDDGTGAGTASGPPHHDHPWSAYMVVKGLDRTGKLATNDAPNAVSWPYIRLADLYLSYAEALNEYDPGNPDVVNYLNKVRMRAGIAAIGTSTAGGESRVYADAVGDQAKQRALILREREVELAFEQQRFDDARTLMQAAQTNHGPTYGMNKLATDSKADGEFWKRYNFQNRVFLLKHYLFPFQQNLLDRNRNIQQNYGW